MALGAIAMAVAWAMYAVFLRSDGDFEHTLPASEKQAHPRAETVRDSIEESPQSRRISPRESSRPSGRALDLADLHASCPSFRTVIDAECLATLDAYFQDRPVPSGVLAVADTPTWRDVFDDPAATRRETLSALAEGICDVANGEIRRHLGSNCNARSTAELAVLLRECSQDHELTMRYDHLERRLSQIEDIVDNSIYWQRRSAIEQDVFQSAWLIEKCGAIPADVMAPLDRFAISVDDIYVSGHPDSFYPDRPLDDGEAVFYRLEEAEKLIETAARLGDAWALSEFRGDAAHIDRLFEFSPTQAYIHQAELEIEKVRQRYRREHYEGLDRQLAERLREVDQRYPRIVAAQTWGRARAQALIRGDSAEVRRLQSEDPFAALSDDQELEEWRRRDREYRDEQSAVFDEIDRVRSEIGTRMEHDERLVRLTYAMLVEAEAESAGMNVDVMALYERAAPFSPDDIEVARQRASAISLLRSQSVPEDQ